jgi:hypothetical protein
VWLSLWYVTCEDRQQGRARGAGCRDAGRQGGQEARRRGGEEARRRGGDQEARRRGGDQEARRGPGGEEGTRRRGGGQEARRGPGGEETRRRGGQEARRNDRDCRGTEWPSNTTLVDPTITTRAAVGFYLYTSFVDYLWLEGQIAPLEVHVRDYDDYCKYHFFCLLWQHLDQAFSRLSTVLVCVVLLAQH